jgi:3D (Asp-Asp-Asp) domain-containing protein
MKMVHQNTDLYQVDTSMKFTGYYGPDASELQAYEDQTAIQGERVPLLAPPKGLEQVADTDPNSCDKSGNGELVWCIKDENGGYSKPPTSEEILNGALVGKSKVLGWMTPEKFRSLSMEGSGKVAIKHADGSETHEMMNFGGFNGEQGNLPASIMKCLRSAYPGGPAKTSAFLTWAGMTEKDVMKYTNYVFFKGGGPDNLGVDDIPLVENHIMATDPRVIPTGAIGMLQTSAGNKCSLLMGAGDVGSAIKRARADIYRGEGYQYVTNRLRRWRGISGVPHIGSIAVGRDDVYANYKYGGSDSSAPVLLASASGTLPTEYHGYMYEAHMPSLKERADQDRLAGLFDGYEKNKRAGLYDIAFGEMVAQALYGAQINDVCLSLFNVPECFDGVDIN